VTSSVVVGADATLTIQPGVEVRVAPGLGIQIGSDGFGGGTLVARGTSGAPIVFTSNVAAPDLPAPGDWSSITLTSLATSAVLTAGGEYQSGSVLEHVIVEFAGSAGNNSGSVIAQESAPFFDSIEVRDSAAPGLRVVGNTTDPVRVIDSTFRRCDHNGSGGGLYINGGSGHLVAGCTFDDNDGGNGGGAFVVAPSSTVTDCTFTNNDAANGGGLYINSTNGTVTDNTMTGNDASSGGGLYALGLTNGLIENNVIESNTAATRGGVDVASGTGVTVSNNTIRFNEANSTIGGLYVAGTGATINGNTIVGNAIVSGQADGGGLYVGSANATVTDNLVMDNVATRNGGGIYAASSGQTYTGNTVTDNTAQLGDGGGIFVAQGNGQYTGNSVMGNFAGNRGGGVFVNNGGANTSFTGNQVTDNESVTNGGGFHWRAAGGSLAGDADVYNVVANNVSSDASAIYYDVANGSDLDATSVCWGMFDAGAISGSIHDFFDDASLGFVLFFPFIDDPACSGTKTPCPADVDGDQLVNFTDLLTVLSNFGPCPGGACDEDVNGDGLVDFTDVLGVLSNWGACAG
ncbi:MAG: right-handed parallel beta-helix repeat-containing protein, partial [Phycisphaerales bacterium]